MKKKIIFIFLALIIGMVAALFYELKLNKLWIFEEEIVEDNLEDEVTSILVINPDYYNPLVSNNIYIRDLSKLVFEGLTAVSSELKYENCLAKIIEVEDDYKNYRIVLKNDVKFHDGTKLTVDDVIYTIKKIQDLEEKSIYYYNVSNIESIKKINNHEIKIKLKEVDNFFPAKLDFPILSELTYSNKDLYKYNEYNGTGKYKVQSKTADEWHLVYNENYREKQSGNLTKINVKMISKLIEGFELLKSGDVEIVDTSTEVGAYGRSAFLNKRYNTGIYQALVFNLKSPKVAEQNVRQAILLGINRDSMIEEFMNGYGKSVTLPINPESYLYDASLPNYAFNPERAQDILNNIGYKLKGTIRSKENSELKLDLLINIDKKMAKEKAEFIKNNLAQIGIEINIIEASTDKYKELFEAKQYDIAITDWSLSYYPEFLYSFETENQNNITGFSDEQYDYLVYMAKREISEEKLIEHFSKMQEILNAKLPMAGLYLETSTLYYTKSIQGEFLSNMANVYAGIENLIKFEENKNE